MHDALSLAKRTSDMLCTRQNVMLVVIVCIQVGIALNGGEYSNLGFLFLVMAMVCVFASHAVRSKVSSPWIWAVCCMVLCGSSLLPAIAQPPSDLFFVSVVMMCVGTVAIIGTTGWVRYGATAVAVVGNGIAYFTTTTWAVNRIDVFNEIQGATLQLLHGHDPYGPLYRSTTPGVDAFHFSSFPGTLLLSVIPRIIGDIRIADMVAMGIIIFCVFVIAKKHVNAQFAWMCVALLLAMPSTEFVLRFAWPELFLMSGILLWIVLKNQFPIVSVLVLGLTMATIPTALPVLGFFWLWFRRERVLITLGAVCAGIVCIPFMLWTGVAAFYKDTIGLQIVLPMRIDALTINAFLYNNFHRLIPQELTLAILIIVVGLVWMKGERTSSSAFKLGTEILFFSFLLVKWAFYNYYMIVAVFLVVGLIFDEHFTATVVSESNTSAVSTTPNTK